MKMVSQIMIIYVGGYHYRPPDKAGRLCFCLHLCVCVCICPQDITNTGYRIGMKLVGYYYWVDGTNWLDFGESALKYLCVAEKKLQKMPLLPQLIKISAWVEI